MMKRAGVLGLVALLSVGVFAAGPSEDVLIARAREAAASGNHPTAIVSYDQILKVLPKGDPRVETLSAEVILSYLALKEYTRAIRACMQFLADWPQSKLGFNVSHSMANAYFGLHRPDKAFTVFSAYTFELVRALPSDSRAKAYEVLMAALAGMRQTSAVSALRAEAKGLLRDIEGRHLLTGPVQGILEKIKTPSDLQRILGAVPDIERRRVTAVAFGEPDPEPDPSKATRWTLGVALQRDSLTSPNLSQNVVSLLVAADMPLETEGYIAGASLDLDLIAFGPSAAGQSFRAMELDIYGKTRLLGDPTDWEGNLGVGFQFRTSYSDPATTSYQNLLGLYLAPEWRSIMGKSRQAAVRAWASVLLPLGNGLDFGNNALGAAVDFVFLMESGCAHTVSLELERVRVRPAPLVASTEVRRVGVAYRFTF